MRLSITNIALLNVVAIRNARFGQVETGMVLAHDLSAQRLDSTSPDGDTDPAGDAVRSMWQMIGMLGQAFSGQGMWGQPTQPGIWASLSYQPHHSHGFHGTATAIAARTNRQITTTAIQNRLANLLKLSSKLLKRRERLERLERSTRCTAGPRCQSTESI